MRAIIRAFRGNLHRTSSRYHSTVDKEEVSKFSELCHSWWSESGDLKALHTLNKLRVPLIRDGIASSEFRATSTPLRGCNILDVGCGGGILTESLARLGADVTGIDASVENIEAAQWHASLDVDVHKNTRYMAQPVEALEDGECYDAVVASEIIEHVSDPNTFIKSCCHLIKPGGSLFVTTINKTWLSWALAVVAAEKIFRLVPDGSHDWNKFVSEQQLSQLLNQNHMSKRLVHGMLLNPLTLKWQWTGDPSMNYAVHAVKQISSEDSSDSSSDSE